MLGLHSRWTINPLLTAPILTPPVTSRIRTKPSRPNACTLRPLTLPPRRATFIVLCILPLLARFAVRTLAYEAAFIPKIQAALLIAAPRTNVIALDHSISSKNITATTATVITIVLYSVRIKTFAPSRMTPAISDISAVPSFIPRT